MEILDELKTKLSTCGYSLHEISRETGVNVSTISRIISGKTQDPRTSIVEKLMNFCDNCKK